MQKTYHPQTGKFLAIIAQSMPEISAEVMQGWIENPKDLKKVLAGALCPPEPTRKWREENSVIYFSVTSDGTTGEDWINRLEGKGFKPGRYSRQLLLSPDFKPTKYMTTEVAVLKGTLFEEWSRSSQIVRAVADEKKLTKPNAEVACLIREKFSDREIEAMGLKEIVVMHEPINSHSEGPLLLSASRADEGHLLCAGYDEPMNDCRWNISDGFAFAVSQFTFIPRPW